MNESKIEVLKQSPAVFSLPEILLRQDLTRLIYHHLGVSKEDEYQFIQDSTTEDLKTRLMCVNSMVESFKSLSPRQG